MHDPADLADRYAHRAYTLRRKVFKILGGAFHLYDPVGNVVLYSKQKAFKLKEDIRLYTDESMAQEVLQIKTQSVWDISGTYQVVDTLEGVTVGGLRRRGMKSMFKDEWLILDAQGQEVGKIEEDSTLKAVLRRINDGLASLMPQGYHATIGGEQVATYQQNFNPFVRKIAVDFGDDTGNRFDPRLGLAAAVLLCAVEGKQ